MITVSNSRPLRARDDLGPPPRLRCRMTRSLYDTLGLTQAATQAEIKKAYHALCLRLHPDKNPGDEVRARPPTCAGKSCRSKLPVLPQSASEKFQALQRVYSVLGDPERRCARVRHPRDRWRSVRCVAAGPAGRCTTRRGWMTWRVRQVRRPCVRVR